MTRTPSTRGTEGVPAVPDSTVEGMPVVPDSTAVRVALWRALHVQVDAPPHVLEDEIGLRLAAPEPDWRQRGDMNPLVTAGFRAEIVARARVVEDLVIEQSQIHGGARQYVILGAGLDTFAQRRPDVAANLRIFEVDQPGPQEWKRRRLLELGLGVPDYLKLVPVDFEAGASWTDRLRDAGFAVDRPAVVVSTGVTLYLTREATSATMRQVAAFAPGSTFVTTFMPPMDLLEPEDRPGLQFAEAGARASGTPFISYYRPEEMLAVARAAGFAGARHVSTAELRDRYFAGRSDGLRVSSGEQLIIATV